MSYDPDVSVFTVAGVPVADVDMDGLIKSVGRCLDRGRDQPGGYVAFCGAHGIVESQRDAGIRAIHQGAWLVASDGRPLYWVGRLKGCRDIRQVSGIESVEAVCRAGRELGWRHYFVGGGPDVARRLGEEMRRRIAGLQVVGHESPPFRPMTAPEAAAMRARIVESGAQIVWVGLSTPKQEKFMAEHAPFLPGTISMGVGAAFDFNIGTMTRAPRLMQVTGTEWLYRLVLEPRRLWRRYAVIVPGFLLVAAANLVGLDRRSAGTGSR